MKGEIKNKYIEYVNHIDFPVVLYVYETNKVVAMNGYAKEIMGKEYEDIRDVFEGKKFRLGKDVIDSEGKLLRGVAITLASGESIQIDMDINVIKVDNVHFVVMLFDESSKDKFSSMNVQVPRVAWMYTDKAKIYMNEALKKDIYTTENVADINEGYEGFILESYLDDSMIDKMNEIKESIIVDGVSQYNSIQMIVKKDESNHFIKVNRMPIVNSNGENIGILNIHNIILDKDTHRKMYDNVLQDIAKQKSVLEDDVTVSVSKSKVEIKSEEKGLPGRIKFEEDVKDYIIDAIERNGNGAMIMFKIENFEYIKFQLGALYVEELNKMIENIVKDVPEFNGCTYKTRNNEYIILLKTDEPSKLENIILLINNKFGGIKQIKDKDVEIEINIGITLYPKDGIKSYALLKNVEYAIYEVKNIEGVNYKYYTGYVINT